MQTRSFVLRSESILSTIINVIKNLPMDGQDVFEILIRPYKKKRSNDQNSLYWVRLDEISNQAWLSGRQFDRDVWHEHLKRELLMDVCAKGVEKWMTLPNGDPALKMSTTDLNTKEFSDYFTQVEAFAANLGVRMSDSRFREVGR